MNLLPALSNLAVLAVRSPRSQGEYRRCLKGFFNWYRGGALTPWYRGGALTPALVHEYRDYLDKLGKGPSTVNQALAAIKKLAAEAAANQMLDPAMAMAIKQVPGIPARGTAIGNWLTEAEASKLLCAPDRATVPGMRDFLVLGLLLGCGLRRHELRGLDLQKIQHRDGRLLIVDLVGKGGRVRSVVMPLWLVISVDDWQIMTGVETGLLVRRVAHNGAVQESGISGQAIYAIVGRYAKAAGVKASPHDLRRTFAKLARQGGAELEQIQITLGHASLITTQRYLGVALNINKPPCDAVRVGAFSLSMRQRNTQT